MGNAANLYSLYRCEVAVSLSIGKSGQLCGTFRTSQILPIIPGLGSAIVATPWNRHNRERLP